LPFLGVGGRQLFKAEVPGPVKDKLTPRIVETARALWITYIILTIAEFVFLLLGGMDVFDSLCHAFATMATGGFSTKDASVGFYNSAYIDAVITIFMAAAGMNFTLHYCLLTGDIRTFYRDPELRFYLGVIFSATLIVTLDLRLHIFQTLGEAFRYGVFHVVSIITTTGFATDNFAKWPALSQVILLLLMFVGGSQGSTGGAIKCIRILLIFKQTYKELYRLVHPHALVRVKLGQQVVSPDTMQGVWGFFALYLGLAALATLFMSSLGLDMLTSFSSVAATLGNVGPGLGLVHPATTYADVPVAGKWILSFCMLVGRLELYTVIVLLVPEFWKK
ncbi:MAG TPA: potassium transporter TrkG, partial [Syntrophales bacterium]|nr:potassium transporter TrkG [Syntrophales bacterium]